MTAVPATRAMAMPVSPTHPAMPATWTDEVRAAALAHAEAVFPAEAAGIVEAGHYVPLENLAEQPSDEIALGGADQLRAAQADLFFHSHPDGIGSPSAHDMIYQHQLGIPFVIAVVPTTDVFCFGDQCLRAPLIGRGFRHGVHDCFSLIRDWHTENGLEFDDCPREWEWWLRGQNLYLDNLRAWGFRVIPTHEATQRGDVLLFAFNQKVPMHGGIVVDQHLMLHHASGIKPVDGTRLSGLVPRVRYQHLISYAVRRSPDAA